MAPGFNQVMAGPTGDDRDRSLRALRRHAPVSPQHAAQRKRRRLPERGCGERKEALIALTEGAPRRAMRGLPAATVLQILPALDETPAARTAVDTAVALLRSGARVIVAAEDGPLNSDLQGLGGEWVRLVTESANPLTVSRNARTLANLVATERIDLVHAVGVGASRSAAALKKRAGIWVVHTYDTADLKRPYRERGYSRALSTGDRVIVPSQYVAEQVTARHQVPRQKLAVIPRRIDGA